MTTQKANDAAKLLDAGHVIILRRCELGSYSAIRVPADCLEAHSLIDGVVDMVVPDTDPDMSIEEIQATQKNITDDFTVGDAIYRLTEKCTTGRIVGVDI